MRPFPVIFILLAASLAGCAAVDDTPAPAGDADGDGIPNSEDTDIDGDGIMNEDDDEPYAPAANQQLMQMLQDLSTFPEWRMETNHGTIRMIMYTGWMPNTTAHISQLAEDGFYNGTIMHRVVDDFVAQGGDPTETGEGGSGPLGTSQSIPLEIYEGLDFGSGAVGLARWTDDTGDSQYFITEKPALHLSRPDSSATGPVFGAYALFAQVFEGQDVVRDIAAVPVDANDKPIMDVAVNGSWMLPPPEDVNLLGIVQNVTGGVRVPIANLTEREYVGELERPMYVVANHPATFRFSTDSTDGDDMPRTCSIAKFSVREPDGSRLDAQTSATENDACTFEALLTFSKSGVHAVLGVEFMVLPWHDDYAAYTG